MKLTFKKQPRESRMIGYPNPNVDIKVDGKVVGYISGPNWQSKDDRWHVHFMVQKKDIMEDGNPNCSWKRIQLKLNYVDESSARESVRHGIGGIINKYTLHYQEE